MKKIILVFLTCVLTFSLVGCGKDKNKDKGKDKTNENKIENTIKDLYTDESKLVYDNGGIYKLVFYYKDNEITGLEHYYEYENENAAKKQYDIDKESLKNNTTIKNVSLSGKYVVYTMSADQYEGKKVDEIKNTYSFLVPVYEK